MRIAFASTFNSRDVHNWSGTPYHMAKSFIEAGVEVDYIGSLQRKLPPLFKAKQIWHKYLSDQRESPRFNVVAAKYYSEQVAAKLKHLQVDAIVSPLINPIAYLDCEQPIILWTDAVYASLVGFYPPFANHSASTIHQGNAITAECLARCRYAVFSSEWAANNAIQLYGASKEKVKVIPFGANIDSYPDLPTIKQLIAQRGNDKIKLLFLAKSWERKGGDIVLAVAKALHDEGYPVELTLVGYTPDGIDQHAAYVNCLGFISKNTPEGKLKLHEILTQSHFLFVPSRAEAYGIVFCEANAFAIPCLTTYVGGIGTIVKDNVNGMTFALDAPISKYCDYIVSLFQDHARYQQLALSSYHEFCQRLNWQSAMVRMKNLLRDAI